MLAQVVDKPIACILWLTLEILYGSHSYAQIQQLKSEFQYLKRVPNPFMTMFNIRSHNHCLLIVQANLLMMMISSFGANGTWM